MRLAGYYRLTARNTLNQRQRSLLAILAVLISTASVTIMLALVLGAKNFYYEQFKSTDKLQQIAVTGQAGLNFMQAQHSENCQNCTPLTNELADEITDIEHVTGLSRIANVNVFESISLGKKQLQASSAQGYQPNDVVQHLFAAGQNFSAGSGEGDIIISKDYADKWGYEGRYNELIGEEVTLRTTRNFTGEGATLPDPAAQFKLCQDGCQASELLPQDPSAISATIVGVESDTNNSLYIPLSWAEKLLTTQRYEITKENQTNYTQAYESWKTRGQRGTEPVPQFTLVSDDRVKKNGYSAFIVEVDNPDNVPVVAKAINKLNVSTASGKNYLNDQLQVFNILSFILAAIGSIALIVAAISIANTMVMATLERTREIGVMRALGARQSTVSRLFTLEASTLGFLGGVAGVVIGYALILLANSFINDQLSANSISGHNIISLPAWLIVVVIAAATFIGMLAGLYPARRAARLDPVDALRRE